MVRRSASMLLVLAATACGGQGTELVDLVNPSVDAGVAAADGAPSKPSTPYTDPFAGAPAYAAPKPGDTQHHPGESCMGCHLTDGPKFLIGGTIYKDYDGTVPAVGVEIRVLDTGGRAASAYSDAVGDFYINAGTNAVTLPAVVGARDATIKRPMITQLTATMGSCAQASCHEPNGYGRIHIP